MAKNLQILLAICLAALVVDSRAEKYICYQTVCEEGIHFCNDKARRCERCEDYPQMCFTDYHQPNCTDVCQYLKEQEFKGRDCSEPPGIQNGAHNGSTIFSFAQGSIVMYSCDDGFTLKGPEIGQCGLYGQWTGPPSCGETTCPVPELPEHVRVLFGGKEKAVFSVGQRVNFSCDDGYQLIGSQSGICTKTGHLDHRVPACIELKYSVTQTEPIGQFIGPQFDIKGWMIAVIVLSVVVVILSLVIGVICTRRNQEYIPLAGNEHNSVVVQMEDEFPSLPVKDVNELQPDTLDKDSGMNTPMTAQSSASTFTQPGSDNSDDTIPMKVVGPDSGKSSDEHKQVVINNHNIVNVTFPNHGNDTRGNPNKPGNEGTGVVTTFGVEETGQTPSPNTERKMEPLIPRQERGSGNVHHPLDDDKGEKAIGSQVVAIDTHTADLPLDDDKGEKAIGTQGIAIDTHTADLPLDDDKGEKAIGVQGVVMETHTSDLPTAGQVLSRQLSNHTEEEEIGKTKFTVGSGEADIQDLEE